MTTQDDLESLRLFADAIRGEYPHSADKIEEACATIEKLQAQVKRTLEALLEVK